MSDTPNEANDCMKLLDAGVTIMLRRGDFGSYDALAIKKGQTVEQAIACENQLTDDFTPAQALYRLTEKFHGRIA